MTQGGFSGLEFGAMKKPKRRERFVQQIQGVTPLALLVGQLGPATEGRAWRASIRLERMLRETINS